MPSEKAYRCDGLACKTVAEQVTAFPFTLRMRTDDKRARLRGFCSWPCLRSYVGTNEE